MPKHSDHDGGLFLFAINLKELQDGGMQTTPPSQQAAPPPLAQGRLEFDFGGTAVPPLHKGERTEEYYHSKFPSVG